MCLYKYDIYVINELFNNETIEKLNLSFNRFQYKLCINSKTANKSKYNNIKKNIDSSRIVICFLTYNLLKQKINLFEIKCAFNIFKPILFLNFENDLKECDKYKCIENIVSNNIEIMCHKFSKINSSSWTSKEFNLLIKHIYDGVMAHVS